MAAVLLCLLLIVSAATLLARTRKGDKLRNDARAAELKGDYDKSLQLALQAVSEDPSDPAYSLELRRVRFEDGMMHVGNGHRLRDGGHLDEALAEFEKAHEVDLSLDVAAQEIKRTKEMIERYKNPGQAPTAAKEEEKSLTPAQLSRKRSQERTDSLQPIPDLRPLNGDLIDLKMANQRPRVLFETVAKLAGVNVLFDPEYEQQQTIRALSIDLTRTTLAQALDQISIISKSFWKPLSANAIFVTVDNPQKRRDYAEQVVRVFYLSNLTSPQEMQEMLTVLRTVVDVQKVFSYTGQNALIVRAEADTMALVEKLISDLDKPRAEVVIDVMVMEVSSTYIRNLSAAFAGTGINTSATFIPRPGITTPGVQAASSTSSTGTTSTPTGGTTTANSTTSPVTSIPLSGLGHISSADYSLTTLPGATFEAVLNDSSTRVLQSPQIRAVSNVKAELKIGTKVPTASGSFQPGVAGVGVSPLVNTQFTYLDVGVNMTITPQVMDNDEVSMHLDLDISQVNNYQNLGGISEPVIGQNKLSTDIRVKEGQVNLIGGIIQQTDSKSTTGIPGLANLPIIGFLFNSQNMEKDRTELVVALIPHIVRGQSVDSANLRGVAAGNATQIKVSYAPQATTATPASTPPVTAPPATAPAMTAPPATAPPVPAPPMTAPPITAPPDGAGPQAAVMPGSGPARITFRPGSVTTQLSSAVTVTLYGENVTNMASAAAQVRFDPAILRINNIVAGDLAQRNAPTVSPSKNILNDAGMADMSISRSASDGAAAGSGGLFTVIFQAVGRGNTNVSVTSSSMTGADGRPMPMAPPPPLVVNVN
jgi:general secretion pathway protein D